MTKFIAFDLEFKELDSKETYDVKLNMIKFALEGSPKNQAVKLEEFQMPFKPEKYGAVPGSPLTVMGIYEGISDEDCEKFCDFIKDAKIFLANEEYKGTGLSLALGQCKQRPIVVSVLEMAKFLSMDNLDLSSMIKNLETNPNESKCEMIMNIFALVWRKLGFIYAVYGV